MFASTTANHNQIIYPTLFRTYTYICTMYIQLEVILHLAYGLYGDFHLFCCCRFSGIHVAEFEVQLCFIGFWVNNNDNDDNDSNKKMCQLFRWYCWDAQLLTAVPFLSCMEFLCDPICRSVKGVFCATEFFEHTINDMIRSYIFPRFIKNSSSISTNSKFVDSSFLNDSDLHDINIVYFYCLISLWVHLKNVHRMRYCNRFFPVIERITLPKKKTS